MKLIKGKYNVAKCFASVIEQEAINQIKTLCDQEFVRESKIRIMPDVHAGAGCTIGTTMTIKDKVVPNVVGVDIGCGMYTVCLGKVNIDYKRLDEACHYIPSGMNVWDSRDEKFDLSKLKCYRQLKNTKRLQKSLGTLGGGNHFIEIDVATDGTKYLVIHSGSRNLGKQVAEYYQNLAIDLNKGKDKFFKEKEYIIKTYKEQGRKGEIEKTLKALEKKYANRQTTIPEELCYVYGEYFQDYIADVEICQQFAKRNREKMAEIILQRTEMKNHGAFHTIHNYIDTKEMILRKGSISAKKGEKILIPINMRDGSVLAVGRGNPNWNYSAPHGAGRIMSRTKAKATLSMSEYKRQMKGVYTTCVNADTLDEAPMVYKSLKDIMGVIKSSVTVVEVLKPVFNFKAGEGVDSRRKNKNGEKV